MIDSAPTDPAKLAREIHQRCCIADAHADALMWNRDLCLRSTEGHVDFPRLKEAGVKLQCFPVVTRGYPLVNGFGLLKWKRNWPPHARQGEWAACVWQLDRMADFCRRSGGQASIVGKSNELAQNVSRGALSAVLGIEGGHALEGKVERVKEVYQRGVRFIGLTHLYNNELGGSSSPLQGNKPLTELGRQMLDEMAKLGMVLDVSHASPKTLEQMLEHPVRPFCSHAGVAKERKLWRNLDDASLKKIADKGGVVGIIFATYYVGGKTLDDICRHIEHAINVMGEDGVGLGSDFDGLIPLPQGIKDVADLPNLTEALLKRGMPVRVAEKVAGENYKRFFLEVLERS